MYVQPETRANRQTKTCADSQVYLQADTQVYIEDDSQLYVSQVHVQADRQMKFRLDRQNGCIGTYIDAQTDAQIDMLTRMTIIDTWTNRQMNWR